MKSRREKIEARLNSPHEGERAAARAALDRTKAAIPERGSPEYEAAMRAWNGDIDWAVSMLGMPGLTPAEVRTIRNIAKYRGTPWTRGAEDFKAVFARLRKLQQKEAKVLIPFVYTPEL